MQPSNEVNPYEAPKQIQKSRFPIYVAAGLVIILLAGSSTAFVLYRAARDRFMNMNRRPIDFHRGPAPDWSEPTLPPLPQNDSTIAVEAPATEPPAPLTESP